MTRETRAASEDKLRFREGQRITWISVALNVMLTALQIVVGIVAHSQSLIADAMHTLSDIVADGFVLVANRKGAEAADAEHPYGHGRYETAASLVLGLVLVLTGAGILVAAAGRLQQSDAVPAVGQAALWAALATLAAKEGLYRYMMAVAVRVRSPMLMANAWHARADALSSLVVAVGIGAALAGFNVADAVAAIIVGGMIVRAGARFAWDAIRELIDTGLAAEEVAAIRDTVAQTPGVLGLHELRTRRMAHKVLVDAHVQVGPRISVSEGHRVAETARQRVLAAHDEVLDVLVHVDPENDALHAPATDLPDRRALLAHLGELLGADLATDAQVVLHYLGGRVEADVLLSPALLAEPARVADMRRRAAACLGSDPWFAAIRLNSQIAP